MISSLSHCGAFYVLRERETQRLLPTAKVATRVEFGDNGPPRLFTTKAAAGSALSAWRMGVWRLTGDEDGCWPEPAQWKGNNEVAERRKATVVDIVPMHLVPSQSQPVPTP